MRKRAQVPYRLAASHTIQTASHINSFSSRSSEAGRTHNIETAAPSKKAPNVRCMVAIGRRRGHVGWFARVTHLCTFICGGGTAPVKPCLVIGSDPFCVRQGPAAANRQGPDTFIWQDLAMQYYLMEGDARHEARR